MKILIIGASGLIGNNLLKFFKKKGLEVFGTYFKNKIKEKNSLKFNILKDDFSSLKNVETFSHVIIVSGGKKKLDDIEDNYNLEKKIGYEKLKNIIKACKKNNIKVIFFSSDAVFDGKKGNYTELSKRNPLNKYGQIKCLTEDFIKKNLTNYLIIRISKVLSSNKKDHNILNDIKNSLKSKNSFFANDEFFSPIFVNDICIHLQKLLKNDSNGIFHLKSLKKISRYQLAKALSKKLKINIQIKKSQLKLFKLRAKRGLKLYLNTNKYDKFFKIREKKLQYYL
mgnify:CR=1 FL=1|tara:strand:- start:840 stop:1685 length:846 start_codon:yes stop_codon:yes gene_type:complete